jgi:pimeloyl-ACP methyl ester carboxylesterase
MMETVVLVHGLWMNGTESALLRRRIGDAGFSPRQFSYRSVTETFDDNAERLKQFVDELPEGKVHLVGHSLGGLLMLKMLAGHADHRDGRLICMGSPLSGSRVANSLVSLPGGSALLGHSVQALITEQPWRWSGPRELGLIAGSSAVGLGRLLTNLPEPNDGTVAVDETHLDGAVDHIVLNVSHTLMLFSPDVAQQVVHFLRHGRFERGDNGQRSSQRAAGP